MTPISQPAQIAYPSAKLIINNFLISCEPFPALARLLQRMRRINKTAIAVLGLLSLAVGLYCEGSATPAVSGRAFFGNSVRAAGNVHALFQGSRKLRAVTPATATGSLEFASRTSLSHDLPFAGYAAPTEVSGGSIAPGESNSTRAPPIS